MSINLDSPFGSASSSNFVRSVAVTWDPGSTVPLNVPGTGPLVGNGLTMTAITAGAGRGASVPTRYSQSTGDIYWEATWTGLLGALAGGIGLINIEALVGVRDVADLALVYAALAADGTNGIILRPDGTILVGGEASEATLHPQAELDTVGIMLNTDQDNLDFLFVNFLGVGGACRGFSAGTFQIPAGSYVPAVVFGTLSVFDAYVVTARFSQANQGAFLGPSVSEDLLEIVPVLGWPETQ